MQTATDLHTLHHTPFVGDCRLYLVSPSEIDLPSFAAVLDEAFGAGDVACFQLRLKLPPGPASDEVILTTAQTLLPIARQHDVAFLINDRPDLAAAAGADGVHIGQDDSTYEEARREVGENGFVGVTCHNSRHLAMVAGEKGADYVAFGAFFPTRTKETKTKADLDLVRWWVQLTNIQCVAIGGITVDNAAPIIAAGADFIAASSGIWNYPGGPGAAVRAFNELIASTRLENQTT